MISSRKLHVDIEFGHLYLEQGKNIDIEMVQKSRALAEAVGNWYKASGNVVSYSILIDNYSNSGQDPAPVIDFLLNNITMPDSIYLEGDFSRPAEELVSRLRKKFIRKKNSGKTFLAQGKDLTDSISSEDAVTLFSLIKNPPTRTIDPFRFALNFDIDYLSMQGERRVSCPVLAATWHASRLGGINENIAPFWGESLFPVDLCISVLPIDYLQVEASVRAFYQAIGDFGKDLASRTRYVFY